MMASCQKTLSYHTDLAQVLDILYPYTRLERMRVTSAPRRHRQKITIRPLPTTNHPSTVQVASDGLLLAKNEKLPFKASVFNDKPGRWCQGIPFSL
jgi:pantothenate kinase